MQSTADFLPAVCRTVERVLGKEVLKHFIFEAVEKQEDRHVFELSGNGRQVVIRGSSPVSLLSGLNWYLKYECKRNLTWSQMKLDLPDPVPMPSAPVRKVRPYKYFYNFNFVAYSYSMAFWDWHRWEQELDWMALNGMDLILELTGHEEVWRRTLVKLGYADDEIKEYLCGPAFFPFQWLGVMYGFGGRLPDRWFEDRVKLAGRIHQRMRELGMTRVLQAYMGFVPPDFQQKYPDSNPLPQGDWVGMQRPAIIPPDDPMYARVAHIFYEEQARLFGTDHFYAGDPFHEGGNLDDVNLTDAARGIQAVMKQADPESVWILQGWWDNPKPELMAGLDPQHTIILDLWGENSPRWKREGEGVFYGLPWVWTFLHNFGGRSGLYGDISGSVNELLEALHHPESKRLIGMGLAPEAIEQNPVMYDLIPEMGWRTDIEMEEWLEAYLERRYGQSHPDASRAWKLLKESAYGYSKQPGPTQSVINQRPTKAGEDKVFKWDSLALYYDKSLVEEACRCLYRAYEDLSASDGYLYDLVDVARQVLANQARQYHLDFMDAYKRKDAAAFQRSSEAFLQLIEIQDQLLGTRKEFMLGPWLEQAKRWGHSEEEKKLYEYNARVLITIWAPDAQDALHDYANREWAGLTQDFYLPRWQIYIQSLQKALETGGPAESVDWFEWEHAWAKKTNRFSTEPEGDIRTIVGLIISSYL